MSFEVEWTEQSALNPGGKREGRLESGEGKKESIATSYTRQWDAAPPIVSDITHIFFLLKK